MDGGNASFLYTEVNNVTTQYISGFDKCGNNVLVGGARAQFGSHCDPLSVETISGHYNGFLSIIQHVHVTIENTILIEQICGGTDAKG